MSAKKLYVIGNSYMDPIRLWRPKEGRSAWLNTCRSFVRIQQKYPMLRFVRSSVACYRWQEGCEPELFRTIASLIDAGRGEAVGGREEQSDTVITPAAQLRQSRFGREYFRRKFGRRFRSRTASILSARTAACRSFWRQAASAATCGCARTGPQKRCLTSSAGKVTT